MINTSAIRPVGTCRDNKGIVPNGCVASHRGQTQARGSWARPPDPEAIWAHGPVICDRGAREQIERKMRRARDLFMFCLSKALNLFFYCALNGINKNLGSPISAIFFVWQLLTLFCFYVDP